MKRIISVILSLIMLISILNMSCIFASAEDSYEIWSYDTSTNTLTISGVGKTAGFVDADKTYFDDVEILIIEEGITSIGQNAFKDCKSLKSVQLPDSLKTIEDFAFWNTAITEITIPKNVTYVYGYAFSTESLEIVNIYADNINFSSCAFYYANVQRVNIDSLTNWCAYRFGASSNSSNPLEFADLYVNGELVTDLIIPDGVTTINASAFHFCNSIESVTISKTVKNIKSSAFNGCENLKSVFIPKNVIGIGFDAFNNNDNLTDIYYEGTKEEFSNLFTKTPAIPKVTIVHYLNDHEHSFEQVNIVAPKCNATGYTKYQCTICGDTYRGNITDKLEHNYELYITISPSCTDDETEIYLCSESGCMASYSSPIFGTALGHDYVSQTIQPTHTTDGYIRYSCKRCSAAYIDYLDDLKATGHDYIKYVSVNNAIITYACTCGDASITKSVDEVIAMWNTDLINATANKCPQLDVTSDGYINAKDYAKLLCISKYSC